MRVIAGVEQLVEAEPGLISSASCPPSTPATNGSTCRLAPMAGVDHRRQAVDRRRGPDDPVLSFAQGFRRSADPPGSPSAPPGAALLLDEPASPSCPAIPRCERLPCPAPRPTSFRWLLSAMAVSSTGVDALVIIGQDQVIPVSNDGRRLASGTQPASWRPGACRR
jgi:hypothetical protein